MVSAIERSHCISKIYDLFSYENLEEGQIENCQKETPPHDDQGNNSSRCSSNDRFDVPQIALALTEVDEWEIHPFNVHLGRKIGEGYWGQVHRSLIRSVAIRKLRNIISDFRKYEHVFAAVKILKGMFMLISWFQSNLLYIAIIYSL